MVRLQYTRTSHSNGTSLHTKRKQLKVLRKY